MQGTPIAGRTVLFGRGLRSWTPNERHQPEAPQLARTGLGVPATARPPWGPAQANGWYPKLSSDGRFVAYGFWQTFVADLETSESFEITLPSGARLNPLGWEFPATLIAISEEPPAVYRITQGSGWRPEQLDVEPWLAVSNWGNAANGHWTVHSTNREHATIDGQLFRTPHRQYGAVINGPYFATANLSNSYEIMVYRDGQLVRVLPSDNSWVVNEHGDVLTGYYGPIKFYPGEGPGGLVDATIAPWGAEGAAGAVVRLAGEQAPWIWTPTCSGEDECFVMGRRLGETEPIVVPLRAVSVAAVYRPEQREWVVAGSDERGRLKVMWASIDTPRTKLVKTVTKPEPIPLEQIEPLDGPWLVAWYEQNGNCPPDKLPPGNAQVAVRNHSGVVPRPTIVTGDTVEQVRGDIIGYRVGSEGLPGEDPLVAIERMELIAAQWHAKGYRIFFYWDGRGNPPRWPVLPRGTVVELMAYCGAGEPLDAFERDMDRVIAEAASRYDYLALTCQSHTTNRTLLRDPSRAIPAIVRLAKKYRGKVIGLTIFNNSGRDDLNPSSPTYGEGGLTANPQLRPHWNKVFSGVTGLPSFLGGGAVSAPRVTIIDFDKRVSRRDPKGLLVRFDAESEHPITRIEFALEGTNEPAVPVEFPVGRGFDGRYVRAIAFKPTINGTWPLVVTARDAMGAVGSARSSEPVTVTSDPVDPEPQEPVGEKVYREFEDYWKRRWTELGVPDRMREIENRHRLTRGERRMLVELSEARKHDRLSAFTAFAAGFADEQLRRFTAIEQEFKTVQCGALFRVAGELHHQHGHKDVGLNVKTTGNNWEGFATDIFGIRPTINGVVVGDPKDFVLVDCITSVGSADSSPTWHVLGPNENEQRPWSIPPVPR